MALTGTLGTADSRPGNLVPGYGADAGGISLFGGFAFGWSLFGEGTLSQSALLTQQEFEVPTGRRVPLYLTGQQEEVIVGRRVPLYLTVQHWEVIYIKCPIQPVISMAGEGGLSVASAAPLVPACEGTPPTIGTIQ